LWTQVQVDAAREVAARTERDGLSMVRLSFPDVHGVLRGKSITADSLPSALRDGIAITSTLLFKDTSHRTVVPIFTAGAGMGIAEVQGGGDVVMVPDPTTFRVLPWLGGTGWMLCDLYFADGRPVPFATRSLYRRQLDRLEEQGFQFRAGLEVEFILTRIVDPRLNPADAGQPGPPPQVELLHQGYNYLTEQRLDQIEPVTELLRSTTVALGLPLASIELEFGPSQVEFVFKPGVGMQPADDMILFRSAMKQVCRRHGYHASFMARPALPEAMSSGWHLHQSLDTADGKNGFAATGAAPESDAPLSPTGMAWLAGLLAGAREATPFSTPTINGYKRYRPNSLAPDRIAWGTENRGAMLRVIPGINSAATRIENRVGEPSANPYLYLASQVASGLHGLSHGLTPPPPVDDPYSAEAERLPSTLYDALQSMLNGDIIKQEFGQSFSEYFAMIKNSEIIRYNNYITDWEMAEYFDIF
jgi:glutamine synthetase